MLPSDILGLKRSKRFRFEFNYALLMNTIEKMRGSEDAKVKAQKIKEFGESHLGNASHNR